jgi:hypothetical protein
MDCSIKSILFHNDLDEPIGVNPRNGRHTYRSFSPGIHTNVKKFNIDNSIFINIKKYILSGFDGKRCNILKRRKIRDKWSVYQSGG